jgi:hypothetical protein
MGDGVTHIVYPNPTDRIAELEAENARLLQGYMPDSAWQELLDNTLAELAQRDEEYRTAVAEAKRWEVKYKQCFRDLHDAEAAYQKAKSLDPQTSARNCTCETNRSVRCPTHGGWRTPEESF